MRGRARAGLEIIGGRGAAERQLHVRVRIDAAGDDQFSFGVNFLVRFDVEMVTDHSDLAVFDENVGVVIIDSGDHPTVADQRLHLLSPEKVMIVARNVLLSLALSVVTGTAIAGTYAITTDADSGPGSLRQAILDANSGACASPCKILYGSAARPMS